ncbi:hypothetical protein Misp06_04469 [Microbulbifer sp. NBRC 101763]
MILSCVAIVVFVFGKPDTLYYRQHPIKLTIMEEETGEPIEDVVVVARWVVTGGMFNTHSVGVLDIQEAVSDSNGKVVFHGFDKYWRSWFSGEFFHFRSPQLIIYKFGYKPAELTNGQSPDRLLSRKHPAEVFWWGKKEIYLSRYPADPAKRAEEFMTSLNNPARDSRPSLTGGCTWTKMRRMILEIDKQMREAEDLGFYRSSLGPWFTPAPHEINRSDCPGGVEWMKKNRQRATNHITMRASGTKCCALRPFT